MAKIDHAGQPIEEKVKCTDCKPEDYQAPTPSTISNLIKSIIAIYCTTHHFAY